MSDDSVSTASVDQPQLAAATSAADRSKPSTNNSSVVGLAATVAAGSAVLAAAANSGGTSGSTASTGKGAIAPLTEDQASRFLAQAGLGATRAEINALATSGIEAWLTTQFAMPRSTTFWDTLLTTGMGTEKEKFTQFYMDQMTWSTMISATDHLRQRTGLALLSFLVVNNKAVGPTWAPFAVAAYCDGLWDRAFGNYRDILEFVTTSVAMGRYLNSVYNEKANAVTGSIPDENYARELMQLFSIGLYKLNPDGTPIYQNGQPVPTYVQDDVSQLARVFTGYHYAGVGSYNKLENLKLPMVVDNAYHDTGAIKLLGGLINIPAGHTGDQARKIALDALFNHPNVGPFIGRQLIQRLVTSNPSPAYVQRVTSAFNNNGSGVRGDMKAVLRAILLDPEARDDAQVGSKTFGKVREPVLRFVHWARLFNVKSPKMEMFGDTSAPTMLAQGVGRSPSVFNWFRPGFVPPGTKLADANLVAPELQIADESTVIGYVNYLQSAMLGKVAGAQADYRWIMPLADDCFALLKELNCVLAANQIGMGTLAQMVRALGQTPGDTPADKLARIYAAVLLVMSSPEYLVLR